MATIGISDDNYTKLKKLSEETGKPVRALADYFVSKGLEKVVVKEVQRTTKELVL